MIATDKAINVSFGIVDKLASNLVGLLGGTGNLIVEGKDCEERVELKEIDSCVFVCNFPKTVF